MRELIAESAAGLEVTRWIGRFYRTRSRALSGYRQTTRPVANSNRLNGALVTRGVTFLHALLGETYLLKIKRTITADRANSFRLRSCGNRSRGLSNGDSPLAIFSGRSTTTTCQKRACRIRVSCRGSLHSRTRGSRQHRRAPAVSPITS